MYAYHWEMRYVDGKGSFRRAFEFTGYGFLPSPIGSAIIIPMSVNYILNAKTPKISIAQLQNPDVMRAVMLHVLPKDLVYSNLIINLAVTVWSLVIWSFAIKHSREIEFRNAFITALIPTVLFGIYQVWSLLRLL
ncbi:YIP1 family protein [Ferroglobus placidus]|nr:YIP1 family protein [Ferroglobus placidus]